MAHGWDPINNGMGSHSTSKVASNLGKGGAVVEEEECSVKQARLAGVSATENLVPSMPIKRKPKAKLPGVLGEAMGRHRNRKR